MLRRSRSTSEQEVSTQQQGNVMVSADGAARQNTVRNIGLIIGREYKNRVVQRSYIISTIIILVLIAIGICIPTFLQYFTANSNAQTKIGLVNNAGSIANMSGEMLVLFMNVNLNGASSQSTTGSPHFVVTADPADQRDSLQKKVKDGSLSMLLVLERSASGDLRSRLYTNINNTGSTGVNPAQAQVQGLVAELNLLDKSARLGLTIDQMRNLFAPSDLTVINTYQSNVSANDAQTAFVLSLAGVVLIFMSVFLYGSGVAQGVAEEKGNRIVEILVNAATPLQMMVGKIIGIGLAGLTQMVFLVGVAITTMLLQTPLKAALLGNSETAYAGFSLTITGPSLALILLILVYFILGFLLFATLFASVGALVNRQEEVQSAVSPLTWLFTVGYVVSFFAVSTPNETWVKVMSYIPFWTPTLMLVRIATATVAWWEILISIVIMIVSAMVFAVIAARIYRFGILMYGQKPNLRQLFVRVAQAA